MIKENSDFSNFIIEELCKSELEFYKRCANRTQKQKRG